MKTEKMISLNELLRRYCKARNAGEYAREAEIVTAYKNRTGKYIDVDKFIMICYNNKPDEAEYYVSVREALARILEISDMTMLAPEGTKFNFGLK